MHVTEIFSGELKEKGNMLHVKKHMEILDINYRHREISLLQRVSQLLPYYEIPHLLGDVSILNFRNYEISLYEIKV